MVTKYEQIIECLLCAKHHAKCSLFYFSLSTALCRGISDFMVILITVFIHWRSGIRP